MIYLLGRLLDAYGRHPIHLVVLGVARRGRIHRLVELELEAGQHRLAHGLLMAVQLACEHGLLADDDRRCRRRRWWRRWGWRRRRRKRLQRNRGRGLSAGRRRLREAGLADRHAVETVRVAVRSVKGRRRLGGIDQKRLVGPEGARALGFGAVEHRVPGDAGTRPIAARPAHVEARTRFRGR